jgi:phenylalanyl-tRNA synthetase beta chain
MLISKKWLQEFVAFPKTISNKTLGDLITLSTVEVEGIQDQAVDLNQVVVGKIKDVIDHPKADRLRVCHVDVGDYVVQVVCGGSNVVVGMMVAVALPGAFVRWHGKGELVEIKKTTLRGEKSEGMICASSEIGLPQIEEEDEIRDLGDVDVVPGTPLASALGLDDCLFDIEHKSLTNRPDLMGHYGMAREVAVLTRTELASYEPKKISDGKGMRISVEVEDKDACPRYMAVAMDGITVGPSPEWMRQRLEACGVRSINNVVDVTNYVMLELGQPMHAFDADVFGEQIVVRSACGKEKITALDEKTYTVDPSMLLITNGEKPMAIAGVMGGEGSSVGEKTTRVILESANFDPVSVRKTSANLGLRTESSSRFEKALDPELCELALQRAVELIKDVSQNSNVASKVIDVFSNPSKPTTVSFSSDLVRQRLGVEIPVKDMEDILTRLGFGVRLKKHDLVVTIPSWRATKDVEIVEDVIEEIARIWGYNEIESCLPCFTISPPLVDPIQRYSRLIRTVLCDMGANETYQYAFVRPETINALGMSVEDHLKLANPLAEDRPYLLRSLIPNLLEAVIKNQRNFDEVSLFQVERVFFPEKNGEDRGDGEGVLPYQPHVVTLVYTRRGEEQPFWVAKAYLEQLLSALGYTSVSYQASETTLSWQHTARQAVVMLNDVEVGVLAEVDPICAQNLGLDTRTACFEINIDVLSQIEPVQASYESPIKYPSVYRDIAFIVSEKTLYADVERLIKKMIPRYLKRINLFDVYRGKGVEEGKKSMALHLTFRTTEGTLDSTSVDQEIQKVRCVLEKEFNAIMRS